MYKIIHRGTINMSKNKYKKCDECAIVPIAYRFFFFLLWNCFGIGTCDPFYLDKSLTIFSLSSLRSLFYNTECNAPKTPDPKKKFENSYKIHRIGTRCHINIKRR